MTDALRLVRLLLLDSPTAEPNWGPFADALSEAMGGLCVIAIEFPRSGKPGVWAASRIPIDQIRGYVMRHSEQVDWYRTHGTAPGQVVSVRDLPRSSATLEAERVLLAPLDFTLATRLEVVLAGEDGRINSVAAIYARTGQKSFPPEKVALLRELAPWMVHARRVQAALSDSSAAADGLLASMDRLVFGIALIDEHGHVVFANRSACELLEERSSVDAPFRRDRAEAPRREAVRAGVARILRAFSDDPDHAALRVAHPEDDRPLQVMVGPIYSERHAGNDVLGATITTAMFVSDPSRTPGSNPIERLQTLYELTPAEARLALLLAADMSLEEASEALGIQQSTARTRLKFIFAKTGARRQASLVRLITAGPGQLRDDH